MDTVEERASELENVSRETFRTEKQREKRLKKRENRISKNCETTAKDITYAERDYQKEKCVV